MTAGRGGLPRSDGGAAASAPGRPGRPWATWAGPAWSSARTCPPPSFVGYDQHRHRPAPRWWPWWWRTSWPEELMPGVEAIVVLDKTPFYAEMGGQVADHGIISADGVTFQVTDVQKNKGGKYHAHRQAHQGSLKVGDTVTASIDVDRRKAIMRAHSATHLLDAVLRTRCWATTSTRPAPWWSPTAALRLHPLLRPDRRGARPGQRPGQRGRAGGLRRGAPRSCPSRRPSRRAPSPCSARSTATPSGWWTWARATRWSSAAAPTWTTPPRSACSTSTASSPWPPACGASRPPPALSLPGDHEPEPDAAL